MPISEVYNMDCMEYMKGIPDKFFDLAIVDPQYGIDIMHKGGMPKHLGFKQYKRKDWDKSPPGKKYFEELFRVSKNQIIFGGNYFTTYLPPKMGWIVWDKGQHGLTMSDGELAWSSFDKALRIITLNRCTIGERGGNIHRCQKPVKLYAEILRKNAKEGDKIFDSHLGSGSSRIAAYGLGFDFYATEIDEEYFEAQEERFHRECFGEIKTERGTLVQTNLFDREKMKQTVEEAASENILFNHRTVDRTLSGKDLAKFGEMNFVQGAEWKSKQSLWISVKERLPEPNKEVLLYDKNSIRHYVIGLSLIHI